MFHVKHSGDHPRTLGRPIVVRRGALLTKYAIFVVFGVVAFVAGVPSIDLATPHGYLPIWAGFIVVSATLALVTCAMSTHEDDAWERAEWWALLVLISFLTVYVAALFAPAAEGDTGRQALAAIIPIVLVVPVDRWISLLPKGRKPRRPRKAKAEGQEA